MAKRRVWLGLVLACAVLTGTATQAQDIQTFSRGDVNADGFLNLNDVFSFLSYVFQGGAPALDCDKAYDFNGNGGHGVDDVIAVLEYMFTGGDPLPEPFGDCGQDPGDNALTCNEYTDCPLVFDGLDPETLALYDEVSHVLRRVAYGSTPELFDRIIAPEADGGLDGDVLAYIDEQLNPIAETGMDEMNDRLDTLNFNDPITGRLDDLHRMWWVRGIYNENQLVETLTDFWDNHFNTYFFVFRNYLRSLTSGGSSIFNNSEATWIATHYEWVENQGFRDNALGSFEDLLLTSALSVVMTVYLDSNLNIVGNPNENYAREILELHTHGDGNGYLQADIEELAKVFTGWNICFVDPLDPDYVDTGDPIQDAIDNAHLDCVEPGLDPFGDGLALAFHFNPEDHDWTEKRIFSAFGPSNEYVVDANPDGETDPTGEAVNGLQEGLDFINYLAGKSETAEYVSTKLAQKYVADDPPGSLIADMAVTWDDDGAGNVGNMKAVMETMLTSDEFLENRLDKVQTPMEYCLSLIRLFGGDIDANASEIRTMLARTGHLPLYFNTPDGYPESGPDQLGTSKVLERVNFANYIHLDDGDQVTFDIRPILEDHDVTLSSAAEIASFWSHRLFGDTFTVEDFEIMYEFILTHEDGSDLPLNPIANLYERRLRQFMTFLAVIPQALQQ